MVLFITTSGEPQILHKHTYICNLKLMLWLTHPQTCLGRAKHWPLPDDLGSEGEILKHSGIVIARYFFIVLIHVAVGTWPNNNTEDNINIDSKNTEYESTDQWQALLDTVMKLRISQKAGNVLISWATNSFSNMIPSPWSWSVNWFNFAILWAQVCIVTRLQAGRPRNRGLIPSRCKTGSGPSSLLSNMYVGTIPRGVMRPWLEAGYSLPSSA
jgi:hypothetical protein